MENLIQYAILFVSFLCLIVMDVVSYIKRFENFNKSSLPLLISFVSFIVLIFYIIFIRITKLNRKLKNGKNLCLIYKLNLLVLTLLTTFSGVFYSEIWLAIILIVIIELYFEIDFKLLIFFWLYYMVIWVPSYFDILKREGSIQFFDDDPKIFATVFLIYTLFFKRDNLNTYVKSLSYTVVLVILWWSGVNIGNQFEKLLIMVLTLKHFFNVLSEGKFDLTRFFIKLFLNKIGLDFNFCCLYTKKLKKEELVFTNCKAGKIVELPIDSSPYFTYQADDFLIISMEHFGKCLVKLEGINFNFEKLISKENSTLINYLLTNRINVTELNFKFLNINLFHCFDILRILETDLSEFIFKIPELGEKFYLGSWEVQCPNPNKNEALYYIHQSKFLGSTLDKSVFIKSPNIVKEFLGNSKYKRCCSDLMNMSKITKINYLKRKEIMKKPSNALLESIEIIDSESMLKLVRKSKVLVIDHSKSPVKKYYPIFLKIEPPKIENDIKEKVNEYIKKEKEKENNEKSKKNIAGPSEVKKKPVGDVLNLSIIMNDNPSEEFFEKMDEKIENAPSEYSKYLFTELKSYKKVLMTNKQVKENGLLKVYNNNLKEYDGIFQKEVKSSSDSIKKVEKLIVLKDSIIKNRNDIKSYFNGLDNKCKNMINNSINASKIYYDAELIRNKKLRKEKEKEKKGEGKKERKKGGDGEKKKKEMDLNPYRILMTVEAMEIEDQFKLSNRVYSDAQSKILKKSGKRGIELIKPKVNFPINIETKINQINLMKNSIIYKSRKSIGLGFSYGGGRLKSKTRDHIRLLTRCFWSIYQSYIKKYVLDGLGDNKGGREKEGGKKVESDQVLVYYLDSLNEQEVKHSLKVFERGQVGGYSLLSEKNLSRIESLIVKIDEYLELFPQISF